LKPKKAEPTKCSAFFTPRTLHKIVKGIKNGIGIAQDIAEGYNSIAQWAGLPQVSKPFLKKD